MWTDTELTRRFRLALPIVQGPFGGGLSTTDLTGTVSNAGGLGCFGANALEPRQIEALVHELHGMCRDRPFAINLWVNDAESDAPGHAALAAATQLLAPFFRELDLQPPASLPAQFGQDYQAQVEAALRAGTTILSFVFGIPDAEIVRECRRRGVLTIGTATTVDEARALEHAGMDASDRVARASRPVAALPRTELDDRAAAPGCSGTRVQGSPVDAGRTGRAAIARAAGRCIDCRTRSTDCNRAGSPGRLGRPRFFNTRALERIDMIVAVFRSRLAPASSDEYVQCATRMSELARAMSGYISHKSFSAHDGERVTIVEFETEGDLRAWGSHPEHVAAKRRGRATFFTDYRVQVCSILRDARTPENPAPSPACGTAPSRPNNDGM